MEMPGVHRVVSLSFLMSREQPQSTAELAQLLISSVSFFQFTCSEFSSQKQARAEKSVLVERVHPPSCAGVKKPGDLEQKEAQIGTYTLKRSSWWSCVPRRGLCSG